MVAERKQEPNKLSAKKEALRSLVENIDAQAGIIYDPTATAHKARAMMRAQGVRAQDKNATRELMRMRYGDDYEE